MLKLGNVALHWNSQDAKFEKTSMIFSGLPCILMNQSSGKSPKVFASRITLTTWKLTPFNFFRVSQKRAWTIPWACLTTKHNWSVPLLCHPGARIGHFFPGWKNWLWWEVLRQKCGIFSRWSVHSKHWCLLVVNKNGCNWPSIACIVFWPFKACGK